MLRWQESIALKTYFVLGEDTIKSCVNLQDVCVSVCAREIDPLALQSNERIAR